MARHDHFSVPERAGLCVAWLLVWGSFYVVNGVRSCQVDPKADQPHRRWYSVFLLRRFTYDIIAGLTSITWLIACICADHTLENLLATSSRATQAMCAMAIGHWATAMYEEYHMYMGWTRKSAGGLAGCVKMIIHHTIALACFVFVLLSGSLGGVGMQGLLFEVPIIPLAIRDYAKFSQAEFYSQRWAVNLLWTHVYALYPLFRGFCSVLWIASLVPGPVREALRASVHGASFIAYHIGSVVFLIVNIIVVLHYIPMHKEDLRKTQEVCDVVPIITASYGKPTQPEKHVDSKPVQTEKTGNSVVIPSLSHRPSLGGI